MFDNKNILQQYMQSFNINCQSLYDDNAILVEYCGEKLTTKFVKTELCMIKAVLQKSLETFLPDSIKYNEYLITIDVMSALILVLNMQNAKEPTKEELKIAITVISEVLEKNKQNESEKQSIRLLSELLKQTIDMQHTT